MTTHVFHAFPRGIMPKATPVTCTRCGAQMKTTGKTFPHVVFRMKGRKRWVRTRPECVTGAPSDGLASAPKRSVS